MGKITCDLDDADLSYVQTNGKNRLVMFILQIF